MEDKKSFIYSHKSPSIDEQREIRNIRDRYIDEKKEDKKETIKKLDDLVTSIPTMISLIVGILGTLIFGLGMSCVLVWNMWIVGVIVCIIGVFIMGISYPIYLKVHKKLKQKYKEQILKLANEILEEE